MKVCFTSYRLFGDGPVRQPFLENDPANIAYALGGDYISFYSLKKLTDRQLAAAFQSYDLVIAALDVQAIELVRRIIAACPDRVATYSEGHITDYQRLSPAGQISFLTAIRAATFNFLYWEKYVPFYRSLTSKPVAYLPYPYLLNEARRHFIAHDQRPLRIAVPSGLAGYTRNGLASLAVANRLLDEGVAEDLVCWLDTESYDEDLRAVRHFLLSTPFERGPSGKWPKWRKWLLQSRVDYRPLLRLRSKMRRVRSSPLSADTLTEGRVTVHRRAGWMRYLAQLSPARILIDLNNRETVGRNALDCAALGIPCVSTDRSDMQSKMFPETTLTDPWHIDSAAQICSHLLNDSAFYQQVVSGAAAAVRHYDLDGFKQRFDAVMGKYCAST